MKIVTLFVALFVCSALGNIAIFVSPTAGSDSFNGLSQTIGANNAGPFQTLPRVLTYLKSQSPISTAITINLLSGTHYVGSQIDLNSVVVNPTGRIIFYSSASDNAAVSGGVRVSGQWANAPIPGVYSIKINTPYFQTPFRQLFVGDNRRVRARHPNIEDVYVDNLHATNSPYYKPGVPNNNRKVLTYDASIQDNNSNLGFYYRPNDIRDTYKNLDDVNIVMYEFWTAPHVGIKSINPATHYVTFAGSIDFHLEKSFKGYYIENAYEHLDSPGEWYYDKADSTLYYYPLAGENLYNLEITLSSVRTIFNMVGTSSQIVQNVEFRGIKFEHQDWQCKTCNNGMFDWGCTHCDGFAGMVFNHNAIQMAYAKNVYISECEFAHMGEYAIGVWESSYNISIVKNHFYDMGCGAVVVGLPTIQQRSTLVNINNNYIHGGNRVHRSCAGVTVFSGDQVTVSHNEISDMWYTGISVGWSWNDSPNAERNSFNNLVSYNYVHHIGQGEISDMGGIYMLGDQPGTSVSNNIVHDVNCFDYGGFGIYYDFHSNSTLLNNNIIYNTVSDSLMMHYGRDNRVQNNLFISERVGTVNNPNLQDSQNTNDLYEKNIFVQYTAVSPLTYGVPMLLTNNWYKNNVYVNLSADELYFPSGYWGDWSGLRNQDAGSTIQNAPVSLGTISTQIQYYNNLLAAKNLGWIPIDTATPGLVATNGLILGSTWVSLPSKFPFPTQNLDSFVYPLLPNNAQMHKYTFETDNVHQLPSVPGGYGQTYTKGTGFSEVSTDTAVKPVSAASPFRVGPNWSAAELASSTKSLKVQLGYWTVTLYKNQYSGTFFASCDLLLLPGSSLRMELQYRYPGVPGSPVGPSLPLSASASTVSIGGTQTSIGANTWFHLEMTAGVGSNSDGRFNVKYWTVGQNPTSKNFTYDPTSFKGVSLLLFATDSNSNAFYMDNLVYSPQFPFGPHTISIPNALASYPVTSTVLVKFDWTQGVVSSLPFIYVTIIVQDSKGLYAPYYLRRAISYSSSAGFTTDLPLVGMLPNKYNISVLGVALGDFAVNSTNSIPITVAAIVPSVYYKGCYSDPSSDNRDLPVKGPVSITKTTTDKCRYWCGVRRYAYAGLQYGVECYCGNSYGNRGVGALAESNCDVSCSGNTAQKCGGSFANSIYDTTDAAGYLGCYQDQANRDFPFVLPDSSSITVELCRTACKANGYLYAGIQFGLQCYCSSALPRYPKIADTDCNVPCPGDATEMCGGPWRNSVYTALNTSVYSY